MMMFKFHIPVKTERAVAVACSDLLDHWSIIMLIIVAIKPKLSTSSMTEIQYLPADDSTARQKMKQ